MLRTYKTCNLTVGFSKYEFYKKLLDGVTLLRVTLYLDHRFLRDLMIEKVLVSMLSLKIHCLPHQLAIFSLYLIYYNLLVRLERESLVSII